MHPEGCSDCGAMVGHREVLVSDITTGIPSKAWRACRFGGDTVAREEFEKIVEERNACVRDFEEALRLSSVASMISGRMFDNLTTTQARCTELLEENRALRTAAGRSDIKDRPLSATDILGRDRDEWKKRALAAEKKATDLQWGADNARDAAKPEWR